MKSSGLWSRRCPVSSFAPGQLGLMTVETLARRDLIVQACFKIGPDDIHKEIFRPEYLLQTVVQPAGDADRNLLGDS